MGTICEYPCRLDLWAEVVKAKSIQREDVILDHVSAVVGFGSVLSIEEARVQVIEITTSFVAGGKIMVCIKFNLILTILCDIGGVPTYQLVTLGPYAFDKQVAIAEFDPPITAQQLRDEVENARAIVKNWIIVPEIAHTVDSCTTLIITAYADVIVKLTKCHDIIVYGEFDPEIDP